MIIFFVRMGEGGVFMLNNLNIIQNNEYNLRIQLKQLNEYIFLSLINDFQLYYSIINYIILDFLSIYSSRT